MQPTHFTVIVPSQKGTRFFCFSRRTVAAVKYGLVLLGMLIMGLISAISLLVDDVSESNQEKTRLIHKTQSLENALSRSYASQDELEINLQLKQQDLSYVADKLSEIESALALSDDSFNLRDRVDSAALTTAVRHQMMQLIPNGPPVKTGYLSSHYGYRLHPVSKKKAMHHGIDYAVNVGTPIYAPADGVIEVVRKSNKGSGNFLRVAHSFGFTSSYSHLSTFKVKRGDYVKKGQLLGLTGNSGLSTGYHLHYEIRLVGRSLDPLPFTKWKINNFDAMFESNEDVQWDYLVNRIENQMATALRLSSQKAPLSKENSNLLVTSR
ncbi:M23 family metallopeptidase [Vibrio sp. Of14-4]|uniref:M23 family metallopeptidase n=1 Tax=Vibrio sp. Of14-4 TaxID=2724878 RepID=UPI001EF1AEFA|nr:M23 family metallopeptidase [Vibrio sp. Of14-4]MCG7490967.1 M23 family metallopeptidase [Vibrio sp. Of14-4]